MSNAGSLSIGQMATLACVLEVTIPKPGNVHRSADFADTTLTDFLTSAIAIGPAMDAAPDNSLGDSVFNAISATRSIVKANTNLGMVLLLSPLAAVAQDGEITTAAISQYLEDTTSEDCRKIFEAIAVASPGGLGDSDQHDVNLKDAPDHILQAMKFAAGRDMIAAQYGNGFADILQFVWPTIRQEIESGHTLVDAVIHAHLATMHRFPDSLIARKNGAELSQQSAAMARQVIQAGAIGSKDWLRELSKFDFWLRSDGNRRNPGTTADLIASAIFVGLVAGDINGQQVWTGTRKI